MKTIRLTVFAFLLLLCIQFCSCTDNQTVIPEEENGSETHSVWNLIVVTGRVVNLRSGPGTQYGILGQVHEGDSLQVTGGLDDWYRIYVPRRSLFAWIYGPLTSGTELP
ncbi:MAG: SH3 domain-containing protein [Candidatus Aegiribacteria sp.]|nr:SH3 domain-containing protein [Candidatus Aegiribacteria sp.]